MAPRKISDAEQKEVSAIINRIEDAAAQINPIVVRWREQYDMFVYGSKFEDKQDWQVRVSINKFNSTIRHAQGELMATLINVPDWWSLKSKSKLNGRAEILRPPLQKLVNYHLEAANFKRHAGEFILNSLISMGSLYVGWKQELIQNPEYILERTKEEFRKTQSRLAKSVENPQLTDDMSGSELEEKIEEAIAELPALLTGQEVVQPKAKPYIQIGKLDFKDPNHERIYFDPNVSYMEDSEWKAFEFEVELWQLKHWAKLGFFSKSRIDSIPASLPEPRDTQFNIRYKNIQDTPSPKGGQRVLLTIYMGPLIVDNEVKKEQVLYVLANRGCIIKKGDYPFWEPPGHKTAIVNAAVKRIPGRPTGAGIGDNAIELQKTYDSNWQLICDTFRYGIAGINVVDYQALVDKGALKEGIEPGKTIAVKTDPNKVFKRVELTSNLENQVSPIQESLRQAIEELLGINAMMTGAPNLRSRTTAAETNARLAGSQRTVNTIALDLEETFIKPTLQKVLARVLQFGLADLEQNPDVMNILSEGELHELKQLDEAEKLKVLQTYYEFEIKGFSAKQDRDEKLARMNEVLAIINSGGPLGMLVDLPRFMELWAELMELKDDNLLIVKNSPLDLIAAENSTLLGGHMVYPSPEDDDELHIKMQGPLAMAPYSTPEMQMHLQMHQEQLMLKQAQMQMAQEQQLQGGEEQAPPQEALPPQEPQGPMRIRFEPDEQGNRNILIDNLS